MRNSLRINNCHYQQLTHLNTKHKIINDPVYGFITINHPLIFDIIAHPYYQRLRRIHQMALAYLVYPGAVHTRLHHSLGAYHLMTIALQELRTKGFEITQEEFVAAQAAILLHDVGHGPFSHALEKEILPNHHHEELSLLIMEQLNQEFNGALTMAIEIFTDKYSKKFLHQLVSGQLDVDRMDYLTRDSFFTGVSEGVIGYDRILKMLTIHNNELMVEEKGIYSIEKFLVARRQMYWQVYLHKTVLTAEKMLINIVKRVRELFAKENKNLITNSVLDVFLFKNNETLSTATLQQFCKLDDVDVMSAIKKWSSHNDKVLSELCNRILDRKLLKIKIQSDEFSANELYEKLEAVSHTLDISKEDATYFAFTGKTENTIYKTNDEKINILFKNGQVKDITSIEDPLIHKTLTAPVKKFYICCL